MGAADTVGGLTRFRARGPGTDSERRAAIWLNSEVTSRGQQARLEPFWCRPNWALAHAWHVAIGLAGSLISVKEARVGGLLVLVALVSIVADEFAGRSLGRRLTPERASQNVLAATGRDEQRVRLIVTANYDAGRMGLVYRRGARHAVARLRRLTRERSPGWLAWLEIAVALLLAIAILRLGGAGGATIAIAQLILTVGLVLALALLLELSVSSYGPAAADNGTGVAVALALVRALDAAPPRRLAVELVLEGAGEGGGVGLRKHLRAHRRELSQATTVVLGIAPCGAGRPRWWVGDGALLPLRYHARLRDLAGRVSEHEPYLEAAPQRGRASSPAWPARLAGLPAIAIGCLDGRGLVPNSHTPLDTLDRVEDEALDATLALALLLVDAIDSDLARRTDPSSAPARG